MLKVCILLGQWSVASVDVPCSSSSTLELLSGAYKRKFVTLWLTMLFHSQSKNRPPMLFHVRNVGPTTNDSRIRISHRFFVIHLFASSDASALMKCINGNLGAPLPLITILGSAIGHWKAFSDLMSV